MNTNWMNRYMKTKTIEWLLAIGISAAVLFVGYLIFRTPSPAAKGIRAFIERIVNYGS